MNYHFIITVQNGLRRDTFSGDVDVVPGTSRASVYDAIRDQVRAQAGAQASVLFFSLEPDELGG